MSRQWAMIFRLWLHLLLLSWAPLTYSATVSASVDRTSVNVDESFQLFLEGDRDIEAEPDLSPLEANFDIISQSRSRNVSVIPGTATVRTSWQVELMPIRAGTFTLPALDFGSVRSNPVTVLVRAARPSEADGPSHFFLEVDVDEKTPYVQQQVIYTARVFGNVSAIATRLSEPTPEGVDTMLEPLVLGKSASSTAIHAGRSYKVFERRYALYPQASGTLVIPPLQFQAKVIERGGARPGLRHTVRTRIIRVRSEAIEIPVREAPEDASAVWLPARSLSVSESWSASGPIAVGDTLRRRLAVRAAGLTAAQLPELTVKLPEGMKQYPEQPELNNLAKSEGVTGTREQTIALVAIRPGTYTLPAVTVTWWNVETGQTEQAVLPPRTVEVTAGTAVPTATSLRSPDTSIGLDEGVDTTAIYWKWFTVGLALAWLLTLWRWRIDRRRSAPPHRPPPQRSRSPSAKRALAALERACAEHDARAARDALLAWSAAAWPQAPPANLTQLVSRCGDGLSLAVDDLQRSLYAEQSERWDGAQLWEQVKRIEYRAPTPVTEDDAALEPLYKARRHEPGRV